MNFFFEIGPWVLEVMSFKCFFLLLALVAILFSGAISFSYFGRRSPKERFCEIILKSGHWPTRRCRLKKLLTDGWTDIGQISISIAAHLEHFS